MINLQPGIVELLVLVATWLVYAAIALVAVALVWRLVSRPTRR